MDTARFGCRRHKLIFPLIGDGVTGASSFREVRENQSEHVLLLHQNVSSDSDSPFPVDIRAGDVDVILICGATIYIR